VSWSKEETKRKEKRKKAENDRRKISNKNIGIDTLFSFVFKKLHNVSVF
jgi:hypothetical protein